MTKTVAQMALFMVINNPLKLPINHLLPLTKWVWQWRQLFQLHTCICKWNPDLREVWWLEKSLVAWLQMLSRDAQGNESEYQDLRNLILNTRAASGDIWFTISRNLVEEGTQHKLTKVPECCISNSCYQPKTELSGWGRSKEIFTNQE